MGRVEERKRIVSPTCVKDPGAGGRCRGSFFPMRVFADRRVKSGWERKTGGSGDVGMC